MTESKTILKWFREGVTKLRLPKWNEWAYLEVSGLNLKLYSLGHLYDVGCPGKDISIVPLLDELFEQWNPPADYEARKDEIYIETVFDDVFLKGE
jgi:hypothetical protein